LEELSNLYKLFEENYKKLTDSFSSPPQNLSCS
jgi:hypothetical protein